MLLTGAVLLVVKLSMVSAKKKDLNIMGFLPMTGKLFRGGTACLIGANMALRHINDRDDILIDFKLNHIWRDSKVRILY